VQIYDPAAVTHVINSVKGGDSAVEHAYAMSPVELAAKLGTVGFSPESKKEKKEKVPKVKGAGKKKKNNRKKNSKKKEKLNKNKNTIIQGKKLSLAQADKFLAKIAGVKPTVINMAMTYQSVFDIVAQIAVMTIYEIQDRQSLFGTASTTTKIFNPSHVLALYWAVTANHLAKCKCIIGSNSDIITTSDYYVAPALAQFLQQLSDYDAPNGVHYHHTIEQTLQTFYAQQCGTGGISAGGFHPAFATATEVSGQEPQFTVGMTPFTPNNSTTRFPEVSASIKRLVKNPVQAEDILTRAPDAGLYASPLVGNPGDEVIIFRVPEPQAMPLSYLFLNAINVQQLASSFYNILNTIPGLVDTYVTPVGPHKLALWYWCCSNIGYLRGRKLTDPIRESFNLSTKEMETLTVHVRQFDYAFFSFHEFTALMQNADALSGLSMWQIYLYTLAYIWNKTPGCIRAAKVIPGSAGGFPSPFETTIATTAYKVPLVGNQKLSYTIASVAKGFCKPIRHRDVIYVPFFPVQSSSTGPAPFWYALANNPQNWVLNGYQTGPISPVTAGISTTEAFHPYPNYAPVPVPATNVLNYIPWLIANAQPLWADTSLQRNAFMANYKIASRMLTVSTVRKPTVAAKSTDEKLQWSTFTSVEIITQEAVIAVQASFHAVCSHTYFMNAGDSGDTKNVAFHSSSINVQPNNTSMVVNITNLDPGTTSAQGINAQNATNVYDGYLVQGTGDMLPEANHPGKINHNHLMAALQTVNGDVSEAGNVVEGLINTADELIAKI
jgi:hypothetical protein